LSDSGTITAGYWFKPATRTKVMLAATFIAMVMIAQGDKIEGDNTVLTLEFYLLSDG
jgi:hypothetical protein